MIADKPMLGGLLPPPGAVPRPPSRLAFLIAAIVGPLLLFVLSLWIGGEVRDSAVRRQLIRDSYERRLDSADLMAALSQAESAQRGYVVTGDPAFLRSLDDERARVLTALASVGSTDVTDGDRVTYIDQLRTLIDRRFAEMSRVVAIRRHDGLSAAAARIAAGRGVGLTDAARALVARESDAEETAMRARIDVMRSRYVVFAWILWLLTLLIGLLLVAGLWALWRARARRFALERNAHDTSRRLLAMFTGNAEATLVLDADGRIEAANAAAKRLLGYTTGELLGRVVTSLFDRAEEGDFAEMIGLADGQIAHPYWPDRTARHRDGQALAVDIAMGPMDLPDGTHVLMMLRDIAERKSIERLKDEFLATISHELRTPLTSVIGALGLLRKGVAGAVPESAERLIEIAENNSRRLIRLVNDLLDIEKIGTGRMQFDRAPVDLAHVAEVAIDGALGIVDGRAIEIKLVAEDRPSVVQGDRDRLLQVLTNLLSNAIRVSPDGGQVLVSVTHRDGQALVAVEDEGPGIPPEFRGRIFERFSQASSDAEGGSGLGLAISREIVVAHDGRIWFGRAAGGGARFTFALPLSRIEIPLRGSQPCILLAEPDADEALRLREMLEADGCGVDLAASDRATLAAAVSGRHDALVIDIELPAMGGLETVRALRRRAETRTLPVILMSDNAIVVGRDSGGGALELVDWIDKPVEPARLATAVRRAVADAARARPTLLHVDDDVDMLEVAAAVLADQVRVVHATSLASARALISMQEPDVVILDLSLPDGSGATLIPDLRRADGTPIPTIIYSAMDVPRELADQVDAVLVKSRRSLDSLALTTRRILAARPLQAPVSA